MISRPPRGMNGFVLGTLGAALVFAGGTLAVLAGPPMVGDDDGLGTGLIMFALYALVACVGGGVDGWRRLPLPWIAVRWIAVALVTAATATLYSAWGDLAANTGLLSDLLEFGLFLSVLIAGPAVFGGFLARQLRPTSSEPEPVAPAPSPRS